MEVVIAVMCRWTPYYAAQGTLVQEIMGLRAPYEVCRVEEKDINPTLTRVNLNCEQETMCGRIRDTVCRS